MSCHRAFEGLIVGLVVCACGGKVSPDYRHNTASDCAAGDTTITLLAGSLGGPGHLDGIGAAARFQELGGVATDGAGSLYVADRTTIRKVVVATGEVTTVAGSRGITGYADGIGLAAQFVYPSGVATDGTGNLYVADGTTIRKVVVATGEVTTLAGLPETPGHADGIGPAALFVYTSGVATDGAGNLYVADGTTIRRMVVETGEVTTLAGLPETSGYADGIGPAALFAYLSDLASDGAGNLYVADETTIRKVVVATGEVTTLAGLPETPGHADGIGPAALFESPRRVATDGTGSLYVTEGVVIRKVVVATGEVTTFAGSPTGSVGCADGIGPSALFEYPGGVASDGAGNLYVADSITLRRVVVGTGEVTTIAGACAQQRGVDGIGAAARFNYPVGVVSNGAGEVYVADYFAIRQVALATGKVTTLAGSGAMDYRDGIGSDARFSRLSSIAWDGAGSVYVSDGFGPTIVRKLVVATRKVTTFAGARLTSPGSPPVPVDGIGTAAQFGDLCAAAYDGAGNLYFAERGNGAIRKVAVATAEVTTLAGSPWILGTADGIGSAAGFGDRSGLASDSAGNLYVADSNSLRKVVVATGEVTTLALVGSKGELGTADGVCAADQFNYGPSALASDGSGSLYATCGSTIRKVVLATGEVTTVVGSLDRVGVGLGPCPPASLNAPRALAFLPSGQLAVLDEDAVLLVNQSALGR